MQENEDNSTNQANIDKNKSELSPRMVHAGFEGFKLVYDINNNFNATFSLPLQEVPKDQDLYTQASALIACNHNLMDHAFALGRMYNQIREHQQDKQSDSSANTPKPNL